MNIGNAGPTTRRFLIIGSTNDDAPMIRCLRVDPLPGRCRIVADRRMSLIGAVFVDLSNHEDAHRDDILSCHDHLADPPYHDELRGIARRIP